MKKESQSLAPAVIDAAIQPKPTKSEIISALTHLQIAKLEKEQTEGIERRKHLIPEVEADIIRLLRNTKITPENSKPNFGYFHKGEISGISVTVSLDSLPIALQQKLIEFHKLPSYLRCIEAKKIRKEISDKVNNRATTSERVEALLKSDSGRAALNSILESLEKAEA